MKKPSAELMSYLESHPEPHIMCDDAYRILAANTAYRRMTGFSQDVIGKTCYAVSHHYSAPCDCAGESCPLARSLTTGKREKVLHLHYTPKGEEYVNIELIPLRDEQGKVSFFIEKMEPLTKSRQQWHDGQLIGRAPAFQKMLALVARVAPAEATVLLQGESGSGKEVIANAIHHASRRADAPFVVLDCSGVPESLFESELFGHERGAFTGATGVKQGLAEAANGGTLFLDEVGDIPLSMQVKLLRLLESGTYRRVGSTALRRTDIRIISATHRPLETMMRAGHFRQDLFFRLNTFPIRVPPLRERPEDIPLLAEALLQRLVPGRELTLTAAVLQKLKTCPFEGNVRELRNILERATLMCDGTQIKLEHLSDNLSESCSVEQCETEMFLGDFERKALRQALLQHHGSRKELAEKLGISERTLYRKLHIYGLSAPKA